MIYHEADVAKAVGEDPQSAPIPELHKAMFRLAELFVKRSWDATVDDLAALRAAGASEHDLSEWLQIASIQTWFTNSADAGGIPLEGDAVTGPVMARERSFYHEQPNAEKVLTSSADKVLQDGWLETPCCGEKFEIAARWAVDRYGFVPNLFKAVSACPDFYARHQLAMQLLEKPQSSSLPTAMHALVRATVIALNHSSYFEPTACALLKHETEDPPSLETLREDPSETMADDQTRTVLQFVHKMVRSAYKITAADAQTFRDAGLNDDAYVDVFNTVSIQQSLDRLANCVGVAADARPLIISD
jgi:alkylhydroperoxidase family enzyme